MFPVALTVFILLCVGGFFWITLCCAKMKWCETTYDRLSVWCPPMNCGVPSTPRSEIPTQSMRRFMLGPPPSNNRSVNLFKMEHLNKPSSSNDINSNNIMTEPIPPLHSSREDPPLYSPADDPPSYSELDI